MCIYLLKKKTVLKQIITNRIRVFIYILCLFMHSLVQMYKNKVNSYTELSIFFFY